jgi:hypothetical protein
MIAGRVSGLGVRAAVLAALILTSLQLAEPNVTLATDWNDTNPGATVCGNGSHPVANWRSWYIRDSSRLIYGEVDIRYSDYCHTVWTRDVNLTGSGSGYASARSMTSDETVQVYTCPRSTCLSRTTTFTGDVLPSKGSTGWSNQLVLPAGASMGTPASVQPPTIRSIGTLHSGSAAYTMDGGREPVWTQLFSNFQWDYASRQNDSIILSCWNGHGQDCASWAETSAGGYRTLYYRIDSTVPNLVATDLATNDGTGTSIIAAWNAGAPHNPEFVQCFTANCENALVMGVPSGDARLGGNQAVTYSDGIINPCNQSGVLCGPTVSLATHRTIYLDNSRAYDHHCGTIDSGCPNSYNDDRVLVSHEWEHVEGANHCDLDLGVVCHTGIDGVDGTAFWHPQLRDKWALSAIYP